jgi:uncharacterized membrane protein
MKIVSLFKEEDHRKALYASLIFIMLMILFFLLVSLKEPNPPIVEEIIEIEMPEIEVEQGSESGGGSSSDEKVSEPSNDVIEEPARNVDTQVEETVKVNSSNGSTNNNNNRSEPKPDSDFS